MKALVYGDIIWDVYPDGEVIGGAAFNFAAHLAHLDNETYLVSAIGKDQLGARAISEATRHGILTDYIQENDHPTGSCAVTLDQNAIPHFDVKQNASYDYVAVDDALIEKLQALNPDVFYFSTLSQRTAFSRQSLKKIVDNCRFKEILSDVNIREGSYDRESVAYCLEKATIVKISDEEGHYLYDLGLLTDNGEDFPIAVANRYKNLRLIVYTLGKKGSIVYDARNKKTYHSGETGNVKVISTVGAGDCYSATFLSSFFKSGDIPSSIKDATERANIVVANKAAVPF